MRAFTGSKGNGAAGCLGRRTTTARRVRHATAIAVLVAGAASALYGLASAGLAGIMEVLLLAPIVLLRAFDGLLAPLLGWGALSVVAGEISRLQWDMLRDTGESFLTAAAGLAAVLLSGLWLRQHCAAAMTRTSQHLSDAAPRCWMKCHRAGKGQLLHALAVTLQFT